MGLVAALGIGGGALLSRAFLARVDAIARTAEAIIGGDLARRVPVRGTGGLAVEDGGPGVLAEDLPRLTHRFSRGERSRTTPGNGLGLSLMAAVAELHGAALHLAAGALGLRARLCFRLIDVTGRATTTRLRYVRGEQTIPYPSEER